MSDKLQKSFSIDLAMRSLKALKSQDDETAKLWSECLLGLWIDLTDINSGKFCFEERFDRKSILLISAMIDILSRSFLDISNGANAPLFKKPKNTGHPNPNLQVRSRRHLLALVAGVALFNGKAKGLSAEESYREASLRMSKKGLSITWKELRSSWANRTRFEPHMRFIVEKFATGIEGELDQTIETAVTSIKSHYPIL